MDNTQFPQTEQLPPQNGGYGNAEPPQREKKLGFAIASLVLGIVSIIGFCCCINFITAPLALIFGIIALAKKHDGTGLSITGIITAALSIILTAATIYSFKDIIIYSETIAADYQQLIEEQDTVFPAYEEDGTLPEYLKKYLEPPFSDMLEKYDATFYDVMDAFLVEYKNGEFPKPQDGVYFYAGSESALIALRLRLSGS